MITLFLAAGHGGRFREAGYTIPKPLIQVEGKPFIELAQTSLQNIPSRLEFIFHQEIASYPLYNKLDLPGCIHLLPERTRGPVETALVIQQRCVPEDDELLIADCDSFLNPSELKTALIYFRDRKGSGGVLTRRTTDATCSFVQLGPGGLVLKAREKEPFTDISSTGPYWFRSAHQFFQIALHAMKIGETHSIAQLYNQLPTVWSYPVTSFQHLGTPEALDEYRTQHSRLAL